MYQRYVFGGIAVILLLTSGLNALGQTLDPTLKLLEPMVNRKWVGVMHAPDGSASWKTYQEYRSILNGSAVRLTSSIPDIQNSNEGLLHWDRDEKKIALCIVNSRGTYNKGFVSADGGTITMEGVSVTPERKFGFKNTFEFTSDGKMLDKWFQNAFGDRRPGHVVEFTELDVEKSIQKKDQPSSLRGPYLGQMVPGNVAQIFAQGTASTGLYERDCAVSPDGKEIYYSVFIGGWATIMLTRNIDGKWTEPMILPFASDPEFNCVEPCLSADGKRLFFLSTLPPAGEQPKRGWGHQNIWVVDRQADGSWGKPYDLGQPINTPDQEYFPSLTRDGTLYFSRSVASTPSAVYRSQLVNNVYSQPEKLPSPVNGSWSIYNACIAPDESYLIGCVSGKDTTLPKNASRYYISFRSRDGSWSELIDMGDMINPPGSTALSPSISPDGRYFFFSLSQPIALPALKNLKKQSDILKIHSSPFNGAANIYWVSTQIIDEIRKKRH